MYSAAAPTTTRSAAATNEAAARHRGRREGIDSRDGSGASMSDHGSAGPGSGTTVTSGTSVSGSADSRPASSRATCPADGGRSTGFLARRRLMSAARPADRPGLAVSGSGGGPVVIEYRVATDDGPAKGATPVAIR